MLSGEAKARAVAGPFSELVRESGAPEWALQEVSIQARRAVAGQPGADHGGRSRHSTFFGHSTARQR